MLTQIAFEIAVIFMLLIANGIFAMAEIAIVSARRVRLQQWQSEGSRGAKVAIELSDSPSHFLSTVQVGITLIGILSGVVGGATLAEHIGAVLVHKFALDADIAEVIGVVLVVGGITYLSVVIGEIVPKRLALAAPERIATVLARPMRRLSIIAFPFVWFFTFSTETVLRLIGLDPRAQGPTMTAEEIKAVIEQGAQEGILEESERAIAARVLSFGKRRVASLMTISKNVVWLNLEEPPDVQRALIQAHPHSAYPVARGSLDNLEGIVQAKDLFRVWRDDAMDIAPLILPPLFIPETATGLELLDQFRETGIHMGFIVDEFGAILGIATLNDALEAIVGSLRSEDGNGALLVQGNDTWQIEGTFPIDEFKERFGVGALPGEKVARFHTLAGFVMWYLGRVPVEGDTFVWSGFQFEVVRMDRNRVDRVQLTRKDSGPVLT